MSPRFEPQSLDFLFAQVARLHHHRAHEMLEELGLYRGQPPVLFALQEQGGLTHRELAERLGITPATITRMLQRMEKAGFVKRQPDPSDQRISRVHLTKAGRATHSKLQAILEQMDRESFRGFTEGERTVLRNLLLRMHENLGRALQGKSSMQG